MGREIIGPILGEVTQETIEAADAIAKLLLESNQARRMIKFRSADGLEIEGLAFRSSRGTAVIVADNFIASTNEAGKIDQFLPRK